MQLGYGATDFAYVKFLIWRKKKDTSTPSNITYARQTLANNELTIANLVSENLHYVDID